MIRFTIGRTSGPVSKGRGQGSHFGKDFGVIKQPLLQAPSVFLSVVNLSLPDQGRNVNPNRTLHFAATAVQALVKGWHLALQE